MTTRACGMAGIAALWTVGTALGGGTPVELFLIDFEGFAEETEISNQYADLGVTFEIEGDPTLLPMIALEGNPRVAYFAGGSDRPMSSGIAGLTDPIVDGDFDIPNDIRMNFDPPATSVRFFFIDLDNGPVTATAFDADGAVLDTKTIAPGDPEIMGPSVEFALAGGEIASVLVDVPDVAPVQYAIDYVTFTRPCLDGDCGQTIEVAQESAPGVGDFDDNVLGTLLAYPTTVSPIQFYSYNVPEGDSWNGPSLTPVADRSHLLLAQGPADLTLFIVQDRAVPNDPDGGEAEMSFELVGDPNGAFISVRDDPSGESAAGYIEASPYLILAGWSWNTCCTDGLALSGIDQGTTIYVQFTNFDNIASTDTIKGLTEWVAYSADGNEVALALEEDRRVRLQVAATDPCAADLNRDGVVNAGDLAILLASWGACR